MARLLVTVLLINCVLGLLLLAGFAFFAGLRGFGPDVALHDILRRQMDTVWEPSDLELRDMIGPDGAPVDPLGQPLTGARLSDYVSVLASANIAVTQLESESRRATRATWLFYGAAGVLMANGLLVIFLFRVGEVASEKANEPASPAEAADA